MFQQPKLQKRRQLSSILRKLCYILCYKQIIRIIRLVLFVYKPTCFAIDKF